MFDTHPFRDFEDAARAISAHLHQRLGYRLFLVTRTEGDDWIVLHSEDHGYGVDTGTVLRWSDSFCARMVAGEGPRSAPRSNEIEAYASAPIARTLEIGAYVSVPLTRADGTLFGTLCGIDPTPQDDLPAHDLALVELLARMLSTVLERELEMNDQARSMERLREESIADELTGLRNRRGWEQALEKEEARARRVGSPACVFVIDVDDLKGTNDTAGHDAGDALLKSLARRIEHSLREQDIAARTGGDEFTVLAVECSARAAEHLHQRLQRALEEADIAASIGHAMRDPAGDLSGAWHEADLAMYRAKRGSGVRRDGNDASRERHQ